MSSKVYVALRVPVDPLHAFDVFTQDIGLWWRPSELFALTAEGDGVLAFEAGAGGRLLTTLPGGRCHEIGRILAWEPGRLLAFTWRPESFDAAQSTQVQVRFEAVGNETRVSVEHSAWDTIPSEHVARHGFPDQATFRRVSEWWRSSLAAYLGRIRAAR